MSEQVNPNQRVAEHGKVLTGKREGNAPLDFAGTIATNELNAVHRVFATQKLVSNKLLREEGLRIEVAPIPFALFRRGAD
jgi:hypothetical protein